MRSVYCDHFSITFSLDRCMGHLHDISFNTCSYKRSIVFEKRKRLSLLVWSNWGTHGIVMIYEWDKSCIRRKNLTQIHVHMSDFIYVESRHFTILSRSNSCIENIIIFIKCCSRISDYIFFIHFWRDIFYFSSKVRFYFYRFLKFSICLFNSFSCLFINMSILLYQNFSSWISLSIKIKDITMCDTTDEQFSFWFYFTENFQSRRLEESFFVDSWIQWLVNYKSNVLSFWSLNRTDSTIVWWMHISHLKLCSFFLQTSRSKSCDLSFIFNFRKRIDLFQELRKLRSCKKWFDWVINHFEIYEICNFMLVISFIHFKHWELSFYRFYEFSHYWLNMSIEDFSHSSHSLVRKMISIIFVESFFMITKIQKILNSCDQILTIKNISLWSF